MAEIRVLDKHTAELIAAGEVVERPASVAKELLENAIDAGATQITLSIVRGGIQQLQIADNGSGIEAEYIDKAFVRHANQQNCQCRGSGPHPHPWLPRRSACFHRQRGQGRGADPHRSGRIRLLLSH